MNALFQGGPELKTRSRDGLNFWLLEQKRVIVEDESGKLTIYLMPVDMSSDGASIPAIGKLCGLDHYGDYWPGAFFHDCAYRKKLLKLVGTSYVAANLSESEANEIFNALMFSLGTDDVKRKIIFEALVLFGKTAYEQDAKEAAAEELSQSIVAPTVLQPVSSITMA